MITLHGITAGYPNAPQVLHNLSHTFAGEGVYALMGASGIGKTTLLRVLAGLTKPTQGTIEGVAGKRIVMLFQEDRLLPWCTVLENVLLGMEAPEENRAKDILMALDIGGSHNKKPNELSGGMQRRVALARAIAFSPQILLMDEPFSGVDEQTVSHIAPYVCASAPFILFTSHVLHDAQAMRASVIDFVDGSLLKERTNTIQGSLSSVENRVQ